MAKQKKKIVASTPILTKEQKHILNCLKTKEQRQCVLTGWAEQYQWQHSLGGIAFKLGRLTVSSDSMTYCIYQTIHKLPDEVKEFVYENCEFASISVFGGKTIYAKAKYLRKRPWLIILSHEKINDEYQSVVAHEIAHAWLGHKHEERGMELEIVAQRERDVCLLVKQWGFNGFGAELEERFKDALKKKK